MPVCEMSAEDFNDLRAKLDRYERIEEAARKVSEKFTPDVHPLLRNELMALVNALEGDG